MPISKSPVYARERQMNDLRFRRVRLTARTWLTPTYVSVRVEGSDLAGFDSPGCDDHMRLFFPSEQPKTVEEFRESPSREYTPLAWGADWLEIEFAVHGDAGIAAPWAASAPIGSEIGVGGPRGSAVFAHDPAGWFLAGDETAIPAIRRFLTRAGDAPVHAVIEVPDSEHEIDIDPRVVWVHRGDQPAASALTRYFTLLHETDTPAAHTFFFVAAEQSIVKPARALLEHWGFDPADATIKGYWKRDETD